MKDELEGIDLDQRVRKGWLQMVKDICMFTWVAAAAKKAAGKK